MNTDKATLSTLVRKNDLDIKVIYDCGSRDALDAIELKEMFNSSEFMFSNVIPLQ